MLVGSNFFKFKYFDKTFLKNRFLFFSVFLISMIVITPLITILFGGLIFDWSVSNIAYSYLLSEYILNSFLILLGVLPLTFLLGVSSAYLVTFYNFQLSNFFKWSLILPLAIPPYIFGFSFSAFFEYYGSAFSLLTYLNITNANNFIPKFQPIVGTIVSLSFTLFGYIFVLSRTSFYNQSKKSLEVGRNLGMNNLKLFYKVILPLSRPAIFIGISLVAMESLADYGTASFFGVNTLTTEIFNSWFILDNFHFANLLSFLLLSFILVFFLIEKISRGSSKFYFQNTGSENNFKKKNLKGYKSFFAFGVCFFIFFLSFIFPVLQMIYWLIKFPETYKNLDLIKLNMNTILLVLITSSMIILFSLFCNFGIRNLKSKTLEVLSGFSVSGYAMPGVIVSVLTITALSFLEKYTFFNFKGIFIGTLAGLVLAYFFRFYSISYHSIRANYSKINYSIDESASLLGYKKFQTFLNIHFPYIKKSLILIFILIAIEVFKELPITLVLRPFNFETFSTIAFNFASQDLIEASALPSLFLIMWTSIFIIITLKYNPID